MWVAQWGVPVDAGGAEDWVTACAPTLAGALFVALARFLGAVGFAVDGDDLGVVGEAIHQRDDAGGVREHFLPLREGAVGGDQRALAAVALREQLKQQVGMAVGVG